MTVVIAVAILIAKGLVVVPSVPATVVMVIVVTVAVHAMAAKGVLKGIR